MLTFVSGCRKNVHNEKALGLSSQRYERGRTRVLEEESGTGENRSGTPEQSDAGKTRGNLAPSDPSARGCFF